MNLVLPRRLVYSRSRTASVICSSECFFAIPLSIGQKHVNRLELWQVCMVGDQQLMPFVSLLRVLDLIFGFSYLQADSRCHCSLFHLTYEISPSSTLLYTCKFWILLCGMKDVSTLNCVTYFPVQSDGLIFHQCLHLHNVSTVSVILSVDTELSKQNYLNVKPSFILNSLALHQY